MTADAGLAEVRGDAARRAPRAPGLDAVVEDAGRERLAAYYLYSALIAGVIGGGLTPAQWPTELAGPMERLGLTRFAPRTERGLDAQLTQAEQATWRSQDRQLEYGQLLIDFINQGAFGPLCGVADEVRLAQSGNRRGLDLELLAGGKVVGTCKAEDHWELVAQHLAGLTLYSDPAAAPAGGRSASGKVAQQLKESGISHAVSVTTNLAVNIHPLGAAVGLGTRLVRSRVRAGREEANAFYGLGQALHSLRDQAYSELRASQGRAGDRK